MSQEVGIPLGPLCALSSSFTWAVGSLVYSRLSQNYSAFAVNFARAAIALPLFFCAAFLVAGGWTEGWAAFEAISATHVGWFTLSMFASYGFGDALFLWSTRSLGVPGALAVASSYPLWAALAGFFWNGDTFSLRMGVGLALTVGGVILVLLYSPERVSLRFPFRGLALGLLTSVLWALNSFAVSRAGKDLSAPVGNVVRMVMGLLLSAGLGKIFFPKSSLLLPVEEIRKWGWVLALEAFGGSYFFIYGLAHSSLAVGAALSSLAPALSVPLAWVLGSERFSWGRTLGVCCVVIGAWQLVSS